MTKIAPSVLSLDFYRFSEQLDLINKSADWLHYDVMDGHFVPNISFGPAILETFSKHSNLFMDVHLMIDDPLFYIERFVQAGANSITFHYEAVETEKIGDVITKIHQLNCHAGISIKPATDVEVLENYLNDLDLVLVMSVEPGFGGQEFKTEAYEKISQLKEIRKNNNYNYLIEVDGGVNNLNAQQLVRSGADVLVAGSYIFKGNITENIKSLRNKRDVNN